MTTNDAIPAGYAYNSAEQKERLQEAATVALSKIMSPEVGVGAVAFVFVMPDGTVSAAFAGNPENPGALASLLASGAEVLRLTLLRASQGKGETKIVRVDP